MINIIQQNIDTIITIVPDSKDVITLLGIKLINYKDFFKLLFRFVFNMAVSITIVRYLYYETTKRKDYLFTFILINATVFLLCILLESVKLELGFALGLFAIFGIIRYRTDPIPIKEMTYLFVIIGLAVINALANKKISYAELVFTNIAVVGIVWGLEKLWLIKHESSKKIIYENIDLIKPQNYKKLHQNLEERTGLKINRIEIGSVNFLRDTADLKVYYYANNNGINLADNEIVENKIDNDD